MAAYTTIDDPSAYFKVQIYTGNGSTQSITFDDTDTDLQPNMLWIKCRTGSEDHVLSDSVRGDSGASSGFYELRPDTTQASGSGSYNGLITALNSDGFSVGNNDVVNTNTEPYVAWAWKETATAGFDMLTYSGNSTNRTISHSLSAVPEMMIIKETSGSADGGNQAWSVYHQATGNTHFVPLNTSEAAIDNNTEFNDTTPTSSVFTVGTANRTNNSNGAYIAYLFAPKQGYSKFGSYTGNGDADGPFVYTGFRPAWVMGRRTDEANNWFIFDNKRSTFNLTDDKLRADTTAAEDDNTSKAIDILSNGIKIRSSDEEFNDSGGTYIYMAFAEAPFVNSEGVPCNAR